MIRMVALDLDGTLLQPDGGIFEPTKQLLKTMHLSGRLIAIATGRPFKKTLELIDHPEMKTGDRFIFPHILVCDERDVFFLTKDGCYRPWLEWNTAAYARERAQLFLSRGIIRSLKALGDLKGCQINSPNEQGRRGFVILRCKDEEQARANYGHLVEMTENFPLTPVRNLWMLYLRSDQVGKGAALMRVAARMNLNPRSVLVAGDSGNDRDMLTREFQVATTDNADPEIKKLVATRQGYISERECSQGVYDILRRYIP